MGEADETHHLVEDLTVKCYALGQFECIMGHSVLLNTITTKVTVTDQSDSNNHEHPGPS